MKKLGLVVLLLVVVSFVNGQNNKALDSKKFVNTYSFDLQMYTEIDSNQESIDDQIIYHNDIAQANSVELRAFNKLDPDSINSIVTKENIKESEIRIDPKVLFKLEETLKKYLNEEWE